MNELGIYLKQLRVENGYSQKNVQDATGITDSQQSRIERGINQEISPLSLKKLASFYNINVIDLYILAGWLSQNDLKSYQRIFKYAELLTENQKKNIQNEIILFTEGNGGHHNAI